MIKNNRKVTFPKVHELNSFKYWTEQYYGSKTNITTITWKGQGEIDRDEIRQWCIDHFGPSGYREDENTSYWVDNSDSDEIMLCKDELLTIFLLRWT